MHRMTSEARRRLLERRRALARCAEKACAQDGAGGDRVVFELTAPAEALSPWLSERQSSELGHIDEALARIDAGTYGACARCGGAIGRQRLLALPEFPHCLSCAGAEQRG